MKIERGGIYWANLNPSKGTEPGKTRPVVVIQTNLLNEAGHTTTVICAVTTKLKAPNPLRVPIDRQNAGLERESEAMADLIRAIDNRRLTGRIGTVSDSEMQALQQAISKVLDFEIEGRQ